MGFVRFLTRNILGIRAEDLPWAMDAWQAIQEGGALRIVEPDVTEKFGLDPERDVARQMVNEQVSMFYLKSKVGHERRETLDILLTAGKRGGLIVYFTDGNPVSWKRPSGRLLHEVPDRERYWYIQILEAAKKVAWA